MYLPRQIKIQIATFTAIAAVATSVMIFGYIKVPAMLGVDRYQVTVQLPEAAGLYKTGNVTYRGTEVGRVDAVNLTDTGVQATLSLKSDIAIPSNLDAQVHSVSAVGEQYVALLPRDATSPPLKDGDVIPRDRVSVPPDINSLLDATNRGLAAVPQDNLETAINESYTAVGGLGPEMARLVKGSTAVAIDARDNLDPLLTLIDHVQPVLDSQTDTADAITAWAAHLNTITGQLQTHDAALAGVVEKGGPGSEEVRQLLDRVKPTLPVLLANLVTVGNVAITYQPALEQLLVLIPQGVANMQAGAVANLHGKPGQKGIYLDFNLSPNFPPTCTTGFLPAQQVRPPSLEDYPDRPAGDLYCRTPQDSVFGVRGAKNYPCLTVPGKRAPTVKMCESDEQYIPLNDGFNWKGDPNATLSGQDVPQLAPEASASATSPGTGPPAGATPPQPIAAVEYNPATGTYVGPDGRVYTQSDLAQHPQEKTWQTMMLPPAHQ
jgi:phospholipid/cholesterol/gamma-HCH transport system substrate-binding protein